MITSNCCVKPITCFLLLESQSINRQDTYDGVRTFRQVRAFSTLAAKHSDQGCFSTVALCWFHWASHWQGCNHAAWSNAANQLQSCGPGSIVGEWALWCCSCCCSKWPLHTGSVLRRGTWVHSVLCTAARSARRGRHVLVLRLLISTRSDLWMRHSSKDYQ